MQVICFADRSRPPKQEVESRAVAEGVLTATKKTRDVTYPSSALLKQWPISSLGTTALQGLSGPPSCELESIFVPLSTAACSSRCSNSAFLLCTTN